MQRPWGGHEELRGGQCGWSTVSKGESGGRMCLPNTCIRDRPPTHTHPKACQGPADPATTLPTSQRSWSKPLPPCRPQCSALHTVGEGSLKVPQPLLQCTPEARALLCPQARAEGHWGDQKEDVNGEFRGSPAQGQPGACGRRYRALIIRLLQASSTGSISESW